MLFSAAQKEKRMLFSLHFLKWNCPASKSLREELGKTRNKEGPKDT